MLDDLTRARLKWMFDNQPDVVKELLDKKRLPELEKSLDRVVIPAMKLKNDLLARGMCEPDAELQALEFLIPSNGPEFSDDPPTPLSLEDQIKVTNLLDDREEARQRLFAGQQK
jgi:hypothetical protein